MRTAVRPASLALDCKPYAAIALMENVHCLSPVLLDTTPKETWWWLFCPGSETSTWCDDSWPRVVFLGASFWVNQTPQACEAKALWRPRMAEARASHAPCLTGTPRFLPMSLKSWMHKAAHFAILSSLTFSLTSVFFFLLVSHTKISLVLNSSPY